MATATSDGATAATVTVNKTSLQGHWQPIVGNMLDVARTWRAMVTGSLELLEVLNNATALTAESDQMVPQLPQKNCRGERGRGVAYAHMQRQTVA
jgi:hypothetical protein